MDDAEMQQRRAEKHAEAPMHPTLKARALEAAIRDRQQQELARTTILCDCPHHPNTLAAAYAEAKRIDYGLKVLAAAEQKALDISSLLRKANCPEFAVARIAHGGLDERPTLYTAKVWQGVDPARLGPDAQGVRRMVAAQMRVRERRPYLLLLGDTDRGKTVAAVWAMAQSMRRYSWNAGAGGGRASFPFAFVRMVEFAAVLAWDSATRDWLEGLKRARMVILDDMGKEHLSPVAQMMLFELLDTRYGQGLSTIITSQESPKKFRLRYDGAPRPDGKPGAIYRRMEERGLILGDAGDAGAVLLAGEDTVKRWPKAADVLPLARPTRKEGEE